MPHYTSPFPGVAQPVKEGRKERTKEGRNERRKEGTKEVRNEGRKEESPHNYCDW